MYKDFCIKVMIKFHNIDKDSSQITQKSFSNFKNHTAPFYTRKFMQYICLKTPKGPSGNTSSSFRFPFGETSPDPLPPLLCFPQVKPQVSNYTPTPFRFLQVIPQV